MAISTKSVWPGSQRNAFASSGMRASETTKYVTSGYIGSSMNMARARSSPEKYAPFLVCEW
jgi:hypothetical protein